VQGASSGDRREATNKRKGLKQRKDVKGTLEQHIHHLDSTWIDHHFRHCICVLSAYQSGCESKLACALFAFFSGAHLSIYRLAPDERRILLRETDTDRDLW
jgi:hypothetical protein